MHRVACVFIWHITWSATFSSGQLTCEGDIRVASIDLQQYGRYLDGFYRREGTWDGNPYYVMEPDIQEWFEKIYIYSVFSKTYWLIGMELGGYSYYFLGDDAASKGPHEAFNWQEVLLECIVAPPPAPGSTLSPTAYTAAPAPLATNLGCSAGFHNALQDHWPDKWSMAGQAMYDLCKCLDSTDQCELCCFYDPATEQVQIQDLEQEPFVPEGGTQEEQIANSVGYARGCDILRCPISWRGDGVCHSYCNNPDCGFDGGDCCSATNLAATPFSTIANPLVCQDPAQQTNDNLVWRFENAQPKCRKKIRDQGSCGSCFAFAVTTMSTHQACYSFVSGNANGQSYSGSRHYHTFAPVYIDSCYPSEIHAGGDLCGGGIVPMAMSHSLLYGIRTEGCYPYPYTGDALSHFGGEYGKLYTCSEVYDLRDREKCKIDESDVLLKPAPRQIEDIKRVKMTVANIGKIKALLRAKGPLVMNINLADSFLAHNHSLGQDGAYNLDMYPSSQFTGAHAMVITGYGFYEGYDAVQGTIIRRYWAVENSWGYDDKGDNGYYYMDMDVDWEAAPMTDHAGATITSKGRVFYSGFDTTIDTFTTDFWGPNVGCQAGPNENANSCVRTKKRRSILEQDPAVTKKLRGLTGRKLMQANLLTKVIPGQENVVDSLIEGDPEDASGKPAETSCDRPGVVEAANFSIPFIEMEAEKYLSPPVKILMEQRENCQSQIVSGEKIDLRVRVESPDLTRNFDVQLTRMSSSKCGAVKLGTDTGNLGCQEDGLVFEDPTNPGSKYMIKVSLAKQEDAPPSPPVTTDTQKPGSGGLRGKVVIKVHVDGDEKMDFVNVMGAAMVAALVVACMVATIVVVVIHSRRKTQKHDNYSSLDKKSSEQPPGISG